MKRIARIILALLVTLSALAVMLAPFTFPVQAQDGNPGTTNLVSCWDLDEASGTRYDSYGSNNLTDYNTVGSAGGVVGNAASGVRANTEHLTTNDNSGISVTGNFTYALWFYLDSKNATYATNISRKYSEYGFLVLAGDASVIRGYFSSSNIDSTIVPSTGTWYFVVIRYNGSNSANLVVNASSYYTGTVTVSDTTQPLSVLGGTTANIGIDGRIDQAIMYKRALTNDEISYLYNGGSGRSCSDVINAQPTSTPTITPGAQREVQLSSGDTAMIKRDITYGDVFVGGLLGVLIVLVIIGGSYALVKGVVSS